MGNSCVTPNMAERGRQTVQSRMRPEAIRTECEAHCSTQNPTPCHGGGTSEGQGSVESRRDTRAETHDAEREADLGDCELPSSS